MNDVESYEGFVVPKRRINQILGETTYDAEGEHCKHKSLAVWLRHGMLYAGAPDHG
jgi:hypothetical protein